MMFWAIILHTLGVQVVSIRYVPGPSNYPLLDSKYHQIRTIRFQLRVVGRSRYMRIHMYVYLHVYLYVYVYMQAHMQTHMYVNMHLYMFMYLCMYMYMYMYVYIYICMNVEPQRCCGPMLDLLQRAIPSKAISTKVLPSTENQYHDCKYRSPSYLMLGYFGLWTLRDNSCGLMRRHCDRERYLAQSNTQF